MLSTKRTNQTWSRTGTTERAEGRSGRDATSPRLAQGSCCGAGSHAAPRGTDTHTGKRGKARRTRPREGRPRSRPGEGRHPAARQTSEQSHEAAPERPKAENSAPVCAGCDTDGLVRAGRRGVSQKPNVHTVLRRVCTLDSSHRTTSHQADETCWPLHSSGTAAHAALLSAAPAQPTLIPPALGGARPVCWVWGRPAMNTAQPPGAP